MSVAGLSCSSFQTRRSSLRSATCGICHGPWLLIEADLVDGRTVTSWPSLRTDLENAGATYVDEAVVIDGNLITSRNPGDIPAFIEAFRLAVTQASVEA